MQLDNVARMLCTRLKIHQRKECLNIFIIVGLEIVKLFVGMGKSRRYWTLSKAKIAGKHLYLKTVNVLSVVSSSSQSEC